MARRDFIDALDRRTPTQSPHAWEWYTTEARPQIDEDELDPLEREDEVGADWAPDDLSEPATYSAPAHLNGPELDWALRVLPPIEADIVEMVLNGVRQDDIGAVLGMSQAGVCYRLKRAGERLEWHRRCPEKPEDLTKVLLALFGDTRRTRGVLHACEVCNNSQAARDLGILSETLHTWVLKAKAIPGPVGEYVTYRTGSMMTTNAGVYGVQRVPPKSLYDERAPTPEELKRIEQLERLQKVKSPEAMGRPGSL